METAEKVMNSLETLCISTVRVLAADAVQKANSGHPGTPMALAPLGHLLWSRFLNYNPQNPNWPGRDRFILSAGHACMLQYSFLYLTGYDLTLSDIKKFRQLHSKTPGHPEYGLTEGIEATTGPWDRVLRMAWDGNRQAMATSTGITNPDLDYLIIIFV
jgi:transketolase